MRPAPQRLRRLAAAALLLAAPAVARAHPLAPSLLSLEQTGAEEVIALWRTPRDGAASAGLRPELPAGCTPAEPKRIHAVGAWRDERQRLHCPAGALAGARIAVHGLAATGQNALVRVQLGDGRIVRALLSAHGPSLVIPAHASRASVFASFFALGARHLWTGADHLLFLLGLVLLLGAGGRLPAAVTSFTLGHSATLALASLGVVRLPEAWVEAGIAASLVALAAEIVRRRAGAAPGLLSRRPWAAPFGFGLLHGLGFAGALGTAGLPGAEIPLALAGFNFGIEAAQGAAVILALGVAAALRAVPEALRRGSARLLAEAIGALGFYLVLDRLVSPLLRP